MPDPLPLTRGKIEGQAIGAGGTYDLLGDRGDARIWVSGDSTLVVEVDMTGGAVGDLVVTVVPYEADNVTPMGPAVALPPVQGPATNPSLNGGHVYWYGQYDVTGVEMVRVRIQNNNAGGQTITRASWRLA